MVYNGIYCQLGDGLCHRSHLIGEPFQQPLIPPFRGTISTTIDSRNHFNNHWLGTTNNHWKNVWIFDSRRLRMFRLSSQDLWSTLCWGVFFFVFHISDTQWSWSIYLQNWVYSLGGFSNVGKYTIYAYIECLGMFFFMCLIYFSFWPWLNSYLLIGDLALIYEFSKKKLPLNSTHSFWGESNLLKCCW